MNILSIRRYLSLSYLCRGRRIYIFVCVKACTDFACTSLEKSKSFIALYAEKNLAVTSTSLAKNGVSKACSAATAIWKRQKNSSLSRKKSLISAPYAKKNSLIKIETSQNGSGKWTQVLFYANHAIKKRMQTMIKK